MRDRNNRIQVRLNESEYEKFSKSVRKSKLSQETYLRAILKGYQLVESPPLEYYDLLKKLRAVGRQMDQIACIAKATGFIHAAKYEEGVDQLWQVMLTIREFYCPRKEMKRRI